MYQVRLLNQAHLRIPSAFSVESCGEPGIVELPSQLQRASPIVLLVGLRGEVVIVPASRNESTIGQITSTICTASLLQKFETLRPPSVHLSVSRPSRFGPVGK